MRKAHLWLAINAIQITAASLKQAFNEYPMIVKYDDEMVVRLNDTATSRLNIDEAINRFALEVWDRSYGYVDLRVKRVSYPSLLHTMNTKSEDNCRIQIPNLQTAIERTYPNPEQIQSSPLLNDSFFNSYQPLESIQTWMDLLTQKYPEIVSKVTIGSSFEGREISGLHVGKRMIRREKAHPRKHIIVNGALHAREWISVAAVAFVAHSLITNPEDKKEIRRMVDEVDWTFFPVINVDGYKETWGSDRLWRKNRQPTGFKLCPGIDIDKSWDFKWQKGVDENPCSETFSGRTPFEAIESRALANYILKLTEDKHTNLIGYFDIHSYSQQILYPYAWSCQSSPRDVENLEELAIGLEKGIRAVHGLKYQVKPACDEEGEDDARIYSKHTNSGSAIDWIYRHGIKWAYQVKLRDTGNFVSYANSMLK